MKVRVKATGEIVDSKATVSFNGDDFYLDELEVIQDTPDYWEKLKHQYSGMTMQGMLANEYAHKLYLDNKNYPNGLLNDSIKIATALVEKLKNE